MHTHFRSRDAGRRRRRPGLVAFAFAAAASLVTSAPALAGTFTVDYGKGSAAYQALPGEANEVGVIPWNGKLKLQDKGVPAVGFVELGSLRCLLNEPYKYECPLAGLTTASIALADGPDIYRDSGSSYHTLVSGGAGGKTVTTGAGNDQIFMRNGAVDNITCGAGADAVLADPSGDVIAPDCEVVDGLQAAGGPATGVNLGANPGASTSSGSGTTGSGGSGDSANGGAPEGEQTLPDALGLSVPAFSVNVPQRDTAVVPLGCAASATAGCRGEVILTLAGGHGPTGDRDRVVAARGRHTNAQRKRNRRLGRSSFQLAAGESVKLPVRIALRGHHALASKRRRRARAALKVVQRDAAGKVLSVQTRTITLRLQKRKWARRVRGDR